MPRSPKGARQRAGLTPASAANLLSCEQQTIQLKTAQINEKSH
jgi:hypothetical protein